MDTKKIIPLNQCERLYQEYNPKIKYNEVFISILFWLQKAQDKRFHVKAEKILKGGNH